MDNKKKITIAVVALVAVIAIAIIVFLLTKNTKTLHTISFSINNGEFVFNQEIQDGKTVNKPSDPTKEGYEFLGWYLGDEEYDFSKPVKENLTLEAKWEEIDETENITKYTVTFDSNGGSSVSKQTVEENKTATAPKNPTRNGYTFKGWYLEDDKFDFSTKITEDITLTAKWEKKEAEESTTQVTKYTVTFDANGGTSVSKQTIEEGKTATTPKNPTRTGYTFKGWYLGDTKFDFSTKITKNIKLTAKWEKNQVISYKVEDVPGSIIGEVKIYVTVDGVKTAGTVDITYTTGKVTVNVPATGLKEVKGTYTSISNPKVK